MYTHALQFLLIPFNISRFPAIITARRVFLHAVNKSYISNNLQFLNVVNDCASIVEVTAVNEL